MLCIPPEHLIRDARMQALYEVPVHVLGDMQAPSQHTSWDYYT